MAYRLTAPRPGPGGLCAAVLGKLQTNECRSPADEFHGRFHRPEWERETMGFLLPASTLCSIILV
jgi:hypothetical protein